MSLTGRERAASTFHFSVVLEGLDDINEELANRLYEAGCDDALLGCCETVVSLDFDREAESFGSGFW